eukprot:scaffold96584_cov20-Cyclotella_meneghiniana.AAC.1
MLAGLKICLPYVHGIKHQHGHERADYAGGCICEGLLSSRIVLHVEPKKPSVVCGGRWARD